MILAVYEGAVVVESSESVGRLEAGRCVLFTDIKSLSVTLNGSVGAAVLWCDARGQEPASPPAPGAMRAESNPMDLLEQVDALMRLGVKIEKKGTEFEKGLRDAVGVAIFSTLRAQAESSAQIPLPSSVRKACDHIHHNFRHPCDLLSLAAVAGVTREHLNVAFRKHLGLTPIRYLWNVRTENAIKMVQSTDLNLAAVAERCGYKSPFHLSREIKRATGQSPRNLRRLSYP